MRNTTGEGKGEGWIDWRGHAIRCDIRQFRICEIRKQGGKTDPFMDIDNDKVRRTRGQVPYRPAALSAV